MKTYHFIVLLLFFCSICVSGTAQEYVPPELEFVCDLKVTIDPPLALGDTPSGKRVIIPITGGTFEGPNMKGTILKGGADYQYVTMDGQRTELEAIYTIKTDDNVLIHVRNMGLIFVPEENDASPSSETYFRAAPQFEAPLDSEYAWLNHAIFICKPVPMKDYISI